MDVIDAPELTPETMTRAHATLGLAIGVRPASAVADGPLVLHDVVGRFDLEPIRHQIGVCAPERIPFQTRTRSGQNVPTVAVVDLARLAPVKDALSQFSPPLPGGYEERFPMAEGFGQRPTAPGQASYRPVINLNYSRLSEYALFEQSNEVRLSDIEFSAPSMDEDTLHAVVELLFITWIAAPGAFQRQRDHTLNMRGIVAWLANDASDVAHSAVVPGRGRPATETGPDAQSLRGKQASRVFADT